MTNERTEHRPRPDDDDDRPTKHGDDPRRRETSTKPEEKSPWLREGADAPDAADIAEPDRQR